MSKQPSGNKQPKLLTVKSKISKMCAVMHKKSKTIRKGIKNHLQANGSLDSIREGSTSKQDKDKEEKQGGNDDSMDDVMGGLSQKEKALSKTVEHMPKIKESLSENEEDILTKKEGFPQKKECLQQKDEDFPKNEEIIEVKHIDDVTEDKKEEKNYLIDDKTESLPQKEENKDEKKDEKGDDDKQNEGKKKLSQNIDEQDAVKNSLTIIFGHNLQEATTENVLFLGSGRKFDTCFNILKGDPRVKMTTGKDNEENKEEGQGEDKEKEKRPHNEEDASTLEYSIHLIKK